MHRFICEHLYGEKAIEGKVIHHIDGNYLHNWKSNLAILSPVDHTVLHVYAERLKK
jgi:HNH endonuclease